MKPTLIRQQGAWWCRGGEWTGVGSTPLQAFSAWLGLAFNLDDFARDGPWNPYAELHGERLH